MARLILLNGAVNAGKSTVAAILRQRCSRLAHIEVDDLNAFIQWMPLEEAVPLNLTNAVDVARNFLAHGLDVLLTYPLAQSDFDFICARLGPGWSILPITLWCDLARNTVNRGTRVLSDWERARIAWMHEQGIARPAFAQVIDNTALSPEQAAQKVIELAGLSTQGEPD